MMIKIMEYDLKGMLPNPFIFDDGTKVISKSDWDKRRKEIYETAVELQYGGMPPAPEVLRVEPLYLGGKGNINTYKITTGKKDKNFSFNMLVFKAEDHAALPTVISGDLRNTLKHLRIIKSILFYLTEPICFLISHNIM